MAADIRNAYLQAPSFEKDNITYGSEFGIENVGRVALIRRAIYGGKVAGGDFWMYLRKCMAELGFESLKADPDVWFRSPNRKNGENYYEYSLLYVDNILVISDCAESLLKDEIVQHCDLMKSSIGPQLQYLSGKLRR